MYLYNIFSTNELTMLNQLLARAVILKFDEGNDEDNMYFLCLIILEMYVPILGFVEYIHY